LTGAALLYNLRLMTRNVDDVKHISGLQIINPFATLD
jgi:predicted nucleic acid-binding protein